MGPPEAGACKWAGLRHPEHLMDAFLFIYQALVLGCLVFFLGMVIGNLLTFEGLRPRPPPAPGDCAAHFRLVPARNEARNIAACAPIAARPGLPEF